jgi:GNAT superfamily N-acetyltransferase
MEPQLSSTPSRRIISKPKLAIRPARFSDMDVVADLLRSSADWYRPIVDDKDMGQHDVAADWARDNFAKRNFYIAEVDGVAIGTISLQYFGRYAYLGYIYLDVAHVGKGHGQALMRFAERVARKVGMVGMALIAHPEATWAKRAYLKYGFEIVETDKQAVVSWQVGALAPYYEEGFELYLFTFADIIGHYTPAEIAPRCAS